MSKKLPYYKWYPRDYLSDENVALMTLEEEGAYRRLLDYCWIQGSIPSDIERLARLCRTSAERMQCIWNAIASCFEKQGDRYVHMRLERERNKAKARSKAARKAAKARWGNDDNADALRSDASTQSDSMPYTEAEAEAETEKLPIRDLWEVWVDEVWDGKTDRRLTDKRRKKLEMVWREHLDGLGDPVGFFRRMVRAMLSDDWWGPKSSTHLPEKAMKNAERREDWAVAAKNGGSGKSLKLTPQQVAERYGDD